MKRRIWALVLAATMIVGASVNVSAATSVSAGDTVSKNDMETLGAGQNVTGDAEVSLPIIHVTVPTTADYVINPFQLTVSTGDAEVNDQIVSAEQSIISKSNVPIAVNVENFYAADANGDVTVLTAAPSAKNTAKAAFLYLEVIKADDNGDYVFGETFNTKTYPGQLAVGATAEKPASKTAIVTLDAVDTTDTSAQDEAKFKLCGSVVTNPVKDGASDPWTTADELTVNFKFTFTPQLVEETTATN